MYNLCFARLSAISPIKRLCNSFIEVGKYTISASNGYGRSIVYRVIVREDALAGCKTVGEAPEMPKNLLSMFS